MKRIMTTALVALAGLAVVPAGAQAKHHKETVLTCGWRSDFTIQVKPRTCFLDWPNLALARAITPSKIHWRHWGQRKATGRAVVRTKTYDPWTPARVTAFRRRRCHGTQTFFYTRVRVRAYGGTTTHKTPKICHPESW